VARRNGGSLPQRDHAAGTRKSDAFGKYPSSKPNPHPNQAQAARYSVTAGREALGTIAETVTGFTAVTTAGIVIGTFPTLREAAAALPGGGDR
jgi:hypothetical protein